jgi:hypothetical protein
VSLNGSVVTVAATATVIATGKVGASWLYVHAPTGGNSVYIGPSTVTTANGFELPKGAVHEFWLAETDVLYGIVSTGTQPLMVMQSGGR